MREHRGGEQASEGESSAAKPRFGGGPSAARESAKPRALVDGRRFESWKSHPLTRARWNRPSAQAGRTGNRAARRRDMKRQRFTLDSPHAVDNAAAGRSPKGLPRSFAEQRSRANRSWQPRRQARGHQGLATPQGRAGADSVHLSPGSTGRASGAGRREAIREPRIRTNRGCTCRKSVAEVGEKHLLQDDRGGPQGKPSPSRGSAARKLEP